MSNRVEVVYTHIATEQKHLLGERRFLDPSSGYLYHTVSAESDTWTGCGYSVAANGVWEKTDGTQVTDVLHLCACTRHPVSECPAGCPEPNADKFKAVHQPGQQFVALADSTLDGRKRGKIKQELFDLGFPNAVQYVAQMMTWAGEHKGYKPHDWKLVPEPQTCFAAAASRHRLKHLCAVDKGFAPASLFDDESGLYHKAHEAFNVLAELELMLTGVIKHD